MDRILERGEMVVIVYFDFQKALDTVSHRPLVELMKYNQIDGSVVYYISDF